MGIQDYNVKKRLKEADDYEASTSLAKSQETGKNYSAAEHTQRSTSGTREFSDGTTRVWDDFNQRWVVKKK
jgi:hypothetical protein